MGQVNRPTPAFFMALVALVALWVPPARCADATAADTTAAPTVGNFSFIEEIRGGVFYDKHPDENGILVSPEVLSSQLPFYSGSNPFLAAFLKPRLIAGAMVSVEGRTSYA